MSINERCFVFYVLKRIGLLMLYVICFSFLGGCHPLSNESQVEKSSATVVLIKTPGNGETPEELENRYIHKTKNILDATGAGTLIGQPGILISSDGTVDYIEFRISSKDPNLLCSVLEKELFYDVDSSGVFAEWNGERVRLGD